MSVFCGYCYHFLKVGYGMKMMEWSVKDFQKVGIQCRSMCKATCEYRENSPPSVKIAGRKFSKVNIYLNCNRIQDRNIKKMLHKPCEPGTFHWKTNEGICVTMKTKNVQCLEMHQLFLVVWYCVDKVFWPFNICLLYYTWYHKHVISHCKAMSTCSQWLCANPH